MKAKLGTHPAFCCPPYTYMDMCLLEVDLSIMFMTEVCVCLDCTVINVSFVFGSVFFLLVFQLTIANLKPSKE